MSFILDALKKSETDRQEKSAPDISDVPTATPQAKSGMGAWYLVGLLSLAVVALLALLLRPTDGPAPIVSQPLAIPERDTAPSPAPTVRETRRIAAAAQQDAERRALQQQPASPPSTAPSPEPAATSPAPRATPEPAQPVAAQTPPPPAESPATNTEALLTFNDLRATGSLDLPDLHIDLHVYSDSPGDRFVFINMNQYRENAVLSEGPRLREITTEGVLLEYVGTTFLLPRE